MSLLLASSGDTAGLWVSWLLLPSYLTFGIAHHQNPQCSGQYPGLKLPVPNKSVYLGRTSQPTVLSGCLSSWGTISELLLWCWGWTQWPPPSRVTLLLFELELNVAVASGLVGLPLLAWNFHPIDKLTRRRPRAPVFSARWSWDEPLSSGWLEEGRPWPLGCDCLELSPCSTEMWGGERGCDAWVLGHLPRTSLLSLRRSSLSWMNVSPFLVCP